MNKVIVARHSPQNGCMCSEGSLPIVRGKLPKRPPTSRGHIAHGFVSGADGRTPSRQGWVADHPELSREAFLESLSVLNDLTEADVDLTLAALEQIAEMPAGTAVACGFVERGIIRKSILFHAHRVVFYDGRRRN